MTRAQQFVNLAAEQVTLVVPYTPLPKQVAFHESPAKYRMYSGCWGGGKTKAGCQEGIKLSLMYPENHGMILRQNFPELRDTTMATFFDELKLYEKASSEDPEYRVPLGDPTWGNSEGVVGYNAGKMSYRFREVNGQYSMVFFKYATGAGRLMAEHLKSFNLGWFYMDEGTDVIKDVWTQLTGRLRRPGTSRCGFTTTNPGSEEHWLYDLFYVQDLPDHEVIETNIYENTHLPSDYIEGLERTLSEDERNRFMMGKWGRFEGQIHKWFDKAKHVKEVDIDGREGQLLCGVDHGFDNPAVLLLVQYDGDTLRLVDEFYQSGCTSDEVIEEAKKFRAKYGRMLAVADPSNPDIIERMKRAGLSVIPNKKKNVVEGISAVASWKDKIEVDPKCVNTIREFGSYRWKKIGGVIQADVPEKKNDHCLVAGTMITTDRGKVPIEDIKEGDLVITRQGFRKVLKAWLTMKDAPVYKVTFSNGAELVGTANHPVYILSRGFVQIRDLKRSDLASKDSIGFCYVRVLAIERLEKRENVFDLTVEDAHEFYANGILVHNSMDSLRYVVVNLGRGGIRKIGEL